MNIEHRELPFIDLSHMWGENLYHWMFDVACDLFWLQEVGINLREKTAIIATECATCTRHFKFTMNYFGIEKHVIFDGRTGVRVEHSNRLSGYPEKSTVVSWNRIAPKKSRQKRRILIQRDTSGRSELSSRNIVNRDELCARFGLEMIFMEDLSFKEQIELMGESALVVAVHGAGLSMTAFCSAGTKVVEIKSPVTRGEMYGCIARYLDLDYRSICSTLVNGSAVTVDLSNMEKVL